MVEVSVLVLAAGLAHGVARWLSVPPVPLLVLAGAAAAAWLPVTGHFLEEAVTVGVAVLLFVAGLELEPSRVRAQRRVALRVGLVQAAVMVLLALGAAPLLGLDAVETGYLALVLTASSTVVGIRLLRRRRQMFEPFGRMVLGTLLIQDLLVILAMPMVTGAGLGTGTPLEGFGSLLVLGIAAWATRRWISPLLVRNTGEELRLLGALSILFLFVRGAAALEVPVVVGAFLAGMSLSRFPANAILRAELAPIGDFFTALFFTALGGLVSFPSVTELWQAGVLSLMVVMVTPPVVSFVAERSGLSSRSGLEAGLLLSQTSEISLVIGLAGMLRGDLAPGMFTVIVLVTTFTMLLTPFISTEEAAERLLALHPSRWRRREPAPTPGRGHLLLVGCGSTGWDLLDLAFLAGTDLVVVDQDPSVVQELRDAGIRALRGEVTDPRILQEAGIAGARAVASTVSRPRDNEQLLEAAGPDVPVLVRVFDEEDARWVKSRGGDAVVSGEAAAGSFLAWWDERVGRAPGVDQGPV